jgi:CheY-like chemotaxis protein
MAKILIVDDNHDIADSIATLLADCGFDVEVAYDGHDALSLATVAVPQAVLLDIGLPSLDGIEVARRLRELHGERIRLVAYTAYTDEFIQRRIRDAPFDFVLKKPATITAVIAALGVDAAK